MNAVGREILLNQLGDPFRQSGQLLPGIVHISWIRFGDSCDGCDDGETRGIDSWIVLYPVGFFLLVEF